MADITPQLQQLADDMLETMYDAPGIGLAAPQVGEMTRLIVMDCVKKEGEAPRPMVLFNPQVLWTSEETNVYEEGCLSIPDQYADVERPAEVRVRWIDQTGARAGRTVRRPLGDLRAARDRPPGWQAVHRLSAPAETPDDHPQDGQAETRTGPDVSVLPILIYGDPRLRQVAEPVVLTPTRCARWPRI